MVQCKSLHVSWKSAHPLLVLGMQAPWSAEPRKRLVSLHSRLLRLVSESLSRRPHFSEMDPIPEIRREAAHP